MRLRLESVSAAYRDAAIVRDVSFEIASGQIACLLGPSGSGKTTLLRLIAGFQAPTAGRILGDGRVLSDAAACLPPERRGIGMVFQDYALLPHQTALQNAAFGLHRQRRSARRVRAQEMLELVGLAHAAAAYPHELSGGEQQRVALARALAPRPGLLLLDEPFSSLDLSLRERLSQDVRGILKHERMTALMVTHSQLEAFAMSDVIGVLAQGRLHQWDSAYRLYHQPADRVVADFVGEGVLLPAEAVGEGMVRTELGALKADDARAREGRRLQVLLRPDDVVHDDASATRATVLNKAFRGAEILYTLQTAGGARVLALVPSHHDHALGEAIGIRLDLEHVVVFNSPDDDHDQSRN